MYCMHCGKEIPDGARFCLGCGKSLVGDPSKKESARDNGQNNAGGQQAGAGQKISNGFNRVLNSTKNAAQKVVNNTEYVVKTQQYSTLQLVILAFSIIALLFATIAMIMTFRELAALSRWGYSVGGPVVVLIFQEAAVFCFFFGALRKKDLFDLIIALSFTFWIIAMFVGDVSSRGIDVTFAYVFIRIVLYAAYVIMWLLHLQTSLSKILLLRVFEGMMIFSAFYYFVCIFLTRGAAGVMLELAYFLLFAGMALLAYLKDRELNNGNSMFKDLSDMTKWTYDNAQANKRNAAAGGENNTPNRRMDAPKSEAAGFCTKCGAPLSAGQVFCGKCGTRVE